MSVLHLARCVRIREVTWRGLAIGLFVGASIVACSEPEGSRDTDHEHEDEHAHEGDPPKTDAHHVAENRRDCEDDVVLTSDALERYGIRVDVAREMTLVPTVSAPGHLAFPQGATARIGSAVAGRVVEIAARSGDVVAKGDTLLVVESAALGEAQSDYLQKRTIARTAAPALDLARQSLERARELHESVQGIALAEVERREAEVRRGEGDREIARAAEAAATNRLRLLGMSDAAIRTLEESGRIEPRCAIVAPIAGRVVEVSVSLGELVDPAKDRLMVVGDLSKLWAIAEVSEARVAEVAIGAAAKVTVPALRRDTHEGVVTAVPVVLEASTRTAEVRIEVPNADGALLPGMFIHVEIASSQGAGEPVLAVPDGAVLTVEGKPSVFVPLEPGGSVFCMHEIRVGTQVGEQIPVLAGLAAGDLVVTAGAFVLKAEHGKASAGHGH
jgi:cobalt-zinc-cadmium efflux system membrane fusion protein